MPGLSNLYDNDEAAPQEEEAGARPGEEGMDEKSEHEEGSTFLVPKEVFADCKPGDRFTVEVNRVLEDQVQLRKVSDDEHEEGQESMEQGEEAAPEGAPGGKYASMME